MGLFGSFAKETGTSGGQNFQISEMVKETWLLCLIWEFNKVVSTNYLGDMQIGVLGPFLPFLPKKDTSGSQKCIHYMKH